MNRKTRKLVIFLCIIGKPPPIYLETSSILPLTEKSPLILLVLVTQLRARLFMIEGTREVKGTIW